ncbi:MAG: DUF3857 domain-containing protein [Pyrinomonadaceae bacterium]
MFTTPRTAAALAITLILTFAALADDPPSWMRQAASVKLPAYDAKTEAAVLLDEQQVTLGSDGRLVTVENFAVRILNKEGRRYALARAFYLVSSGRIREINGWLIRPDGTTKNYDKKTVVDVISDPDDVYDEGRIKVIDAINDVEPGYVFGYTIVSEDTPLFYQDSWGFQTNLPVAVSRYSLTLPAGWRASSVTFNAPDIKPTVNGNTYTWEMRGLDAIKDEPLSPSWNNLSPRIAVNYAPESGQNIVNRAFANWEDVSRWATAMHDPQVVVDDNVAAKARELTANAATELDKIRAIGTFVQNLQYISIDIGVGHGNGYKPRPSTLVLSRGYGDCKDKANLMRAMLRALKIEAYPIAIFSGDRTFVRAEWASPRQFNHCIIAVKVSDATKTPTTIEHPKLGRLLIFDATDAFTPVGDLPDYLQGSYGLIIGGDLGGLFQMPVVPPEADILDRKIDVDLSDTGELKGKIQERAVGQTSTMFRREIRELSSADYKRALEGWLTRGATGAQLVNYTPKDRHADAAFDLDVEFSAPRYGQLMQNRLLVFKPVIVGRRSGVVLTEPKRSNPIELDSSMMRETVTFTLPAGFVVDEMPEPVNIETSFGKYTTSYTHKDGKLIFTRQITTRRDLIPAEKYSIVKDFFAKMLDAEQAPVVLIRK